MSETTARGAETPVLEARALSKVYLDAGALFVAVGVDTTLLVKAASGLVQRFGGRDAMVERALLAGWEALESATAEVCAQAPMNAKGAHAMLKALGTPEAALLAGMVSTSALRQRAKAWRAQVEAALAQRLDSAAPDQAAAMLFAVWQGQVLWNSAGGKGFRLKDALRALSG